MDKLIKCIDVILMIWIFGVMILFIKFRDEPVIKAGKFTI